MDGKHRGQNRQARPIAWVVMVVRMVMIVVVVLVERIHRTRGADGRDELADQPESRVARCRRSEEERPAERVLALWEDVEEGGSGEPR